MSNKPNDTSKSANVFDIERNILRESLKQTEGRCLDLSNRVIQLEKLLKEKTEEVLHLKELLIGNTNPIRIEVSDEEKIAIIQLEMLKSDALTRKLSLEEIKIFDLLVKNKRVAQDKPISRDAEFKSLPSSVDKQKLIEIAASGPKEQE